MQRLMVILGMMVMFVFSVSTSTVMAQCDPNNPPCEGDFNCDCDVDGSDAAVFKSDFGRSPFFFPCPPCQGPAPVPKTGQTTAYATGDDGDLERGIEKPPLKERFTDNEDGTITDNLTGLIWLKNANCFGMRDWNNALSDSNGLEDGECGLTDGSNPGDWRLPNYKELLSLVDVSNSNPALPSGHPFTNLQSALYWSSTTRTVQTAYAWYVDMYLGQTGANSKFGSPFFVWPVRGGY